MNDIHDISPPAVPPVAGAPVDDSAVLSLAEPTAEAVPSRFAEAGRKGARRIQQLIQEGRVYEKEHGLKRGRQRLRQLIAQGKLYEEEHGLTPRRKRRARQSADAQLRGFFDALLRVMKPRLRGRFIRLLEELDRAG